MCVLIIKLIQLKRVYLLCCVASEVHRGQRNSLIRIAFNLFYACVWLKSWLLSYLLKEELLSFVFVGFFKIARELLCVAYR